MDQTQVIRSFNLRHIALNQEQPEVTTPILSMDVYYPGEYDKGVIFHIETELEELSSRTFSHFTQTAGSNLEYLYAIKRTESLFFFREILPLFNPLSKIPDEVQRSSPSDSQDS